MSSSIGLILIDWVFNYSIIILMVLYWSDKLLYNNSVLSSTLDITEIATLIISSSTLNVTEFVPLITSPSTLDAMEFVPLLISSSTLEIMELYHSLFHLN